MFKITPKDQEVIMEVEKIYPSNGKYDIVDHILIRKEVGWYITDLVFDNGDIQPFMKSTKLPILQIKRIKYFSGCKVYVEEGICLCEKKKYYQIEGTNLCRTKEGEVHSF